MRGVGCALAALMLSGHPAPAQSVTAKAELVENSAYSGQLITRIRQAKRRIICAFYVFRIGERRGNLPTAVARELVKAKQRGVEVTVILEGGKRLRRDNRKAAMILSQGGVRVLFTRRGRVTHVKAISIDDRYAVIGSHNMTHAALSRNNELSVLLDSPELALKVRRYLERIVVERGGR